MKIQIEELKQQVEGRIDYHLLRENVIDPINELITTAKILGTDQTAIIKRE